MITAYRLLSYNLPHNLEETINNYIKQGWQPFGTPFIDGDHYYQAIVRYGTDEEVQVYNNFAKTVLGNETSSTSEQSKEDQIKDLYAELRKKASEL